MEKVSSKRYRVLPLVGEFDFCGVEVWVEFAADGQACGGGCGVGDEVDDGLVCLEWSSTSVVGDSGEEPVFNLVPFAGTRWIMGGDNF
jgi:hypothetical protein